MKRLYLLRHAKSSRDQDGLEDIDRPLSPRGRRAAPQMGRYMHDLGYRPAVALCSPAVRARETWELVRRELSGPVEEAVRPELYHADPPTMLGIVRGIDDASDSAILIGHNPGMLTLALGLVGRGVVTANPFGKYPTGALTVFDFDVGRWRDVQPSRGKLVCFTRPKQLGDAG